MLVVAGSDSGGGAGIQADIKAIMAMGGFATTALTALTAQDTHGVHGVFAAPPAFVALQMEVVLRDIGADVVKTGMLGEVSLIETVVRTLDVEAAGIPVVVDPVMVAKGGASLLPGSALSALRSLLLPRAALLTPNAPEAAALAGVEVGDLDQMRAAASILLRAGAAAVLLKGGHLAGAEVVDLLATSDGETLFRSPRQETRHTHGTGCTLASAIAAGLSRGVALAEAVEAARAYVQRAIASAPGLGGGHGPLNHLAPVSR